ncbi:MAG: LamG domain-containing protein [Acidobacteria bacterium]|nr:LamG domain-containing protein [Acidobacteriota bacterium]
MALSDYGGDYQGWYLGGHSSGRVIFSVACLPSSSPWLLSSTALLLNQWYYLAATYDGSTRQATIYINGSADAQGFFAGFTPAPSTDAYLARASWYGGYYLNAALDETRVYPVAKTAAEILSDYQSFPQAPAPAAVAEWKLDDTGVTLADSSGNGHDATAHGAPTVGGGVRNGARSFNGATDWAQAPASSAFSPASFTIRAWVKLLSYPPSPGFAVLVADYGGNYQGWYLGVHSSGRVILSVASLPASSPWLFSTTALSLNTWYHVTATYDGSSRAGTIYISGAADAQGVFPGFTAQSVTDLYFARASWYDGYYAHAALDEVRLLDYRQAPAEVLADYQSFP